VGHALHYFQSELRLSSVRSGTSEWKSGFRNHRRVQIGFHNRIPDSFDDLAVTL